MGSGSDDDDDFHHDAVYKKTTKVSMPTCKNHQQRIFSRHQLPLSYLLEGQMGHDGQEQKQLSRQDPGTGRYFP